MNVNKDQVDIVLFNMSSYREWQKGVSNRNYHVFRNLLINEKVGRILIIDYLPHTFRRVIRNYWENIFLKKDYPVRFKSLGSKVYQVDDKLWVYSTVRNKFSKKKFYDELNKILQKFGPEPLAKNFSFEKFYNIFAPKKTAIKPLLMEQIFLAGVGNIYASEACFCAGILPTRRADKISTLEYRKLYQCLRKILKFAIQKKGASAENYLDALGQEGEMVKYLKVYGRAGEKCKKCGSNIKSVKQGSRTSFYCPKCQR